MIASAQLCIHPFVQRGDAAGLSVLKSVQAHRIERITIGQLRLSQSGKLLRRRGELEFGGDDLFHTVCSLPGKVETCLPVSQQESSCDIEDIRQNGKLAYTSHVWCAAHLYTAL